MRGTCRLICAVVALVTLVLAPAAQAQWVEDGTAIAIGMFAQHEIPDIAPDGQGGAIIVWRDTRNFNQDIFAQRIDAYGKAMWTGNGVPVCTYSGTQTDPVVVSDGAGGAIVAWTDDRSGDDIYAQRLDSLGDTLWTGDGVPICTDANQQDTPVIIADGAGGAVIAWRDFRGGSQSDVYAQRVLSNGTVYWDTDGEAICTATNYQEAVRMVSDGVGGVYFVWQDRRNGTDSDIWAQRVNPHGSPYWTVDGSPVCQESGWQYLPQVCEDGYGGFVVTWYDDRGADLDIYAQRVTTSTAKLWTSGGEAICTASGDQDSQAIAPNGNGGAIIAWRDDQGATEHVYCQRIDGDGTIPWPTNGVRLCTFAIGVQRSPLVAGDDLGGAIVSWIDYRTTNEDVYCQRIDASGSIMWPSFGVPVSAAYDDQRFHVMASDGSGGAIIAWDDYRSAAQIQTQREVYAQRIEGNGYWGYPAPEIASVNDIPGDQGGYINLEWDASRLDPFPELAISFYSMWRALNPAAAAALLKRGGATLVSSAADITFDTRDRVVRLGQLSGADYYWELVATQDANGYEHYAKTLSTPFDSTATSSEHQYYQVCAHASDPSVSWTSAPDSGYSVDNLAPAQPQNLTGDQSTLPIGLDMTWDPNTEDDLSHYAVYRGLSSDFVPGPGNRIAAPTDTTTFDDGWTWDSGYYYKVSAIDIHGNESIFALLVPDGVTGTGDTAVPRISFLSQNYPNPFTRVTSISFGTSEPGEVSLEVYDVSGRLVRVLVDGTRDANRYLETWDGRNANGTPVSSGIYFYKLKTVSFERSMKMLLVR
jgi:hypothetical protein